MFEVTTVKDAKVAVGKLVKTVRKQRKMTQRDLAKRLSVSRNTVQNLEAGKNFTADTLLKVLYEFDMLGDFYREVERQRDIIEHTKSLY